MMKQSNIFFGQFLCCFPLPLPSLDHCGKKKRQRKLPQFTRKLPAYRFLHSLAPAKKVFPVPAVLSVLLLAVIRHDLRKEPLQVDYFQKITFVYHLIYRKLTDYSTHCYSNIVFNVEFLFNV